MNAKLIQKSVNSLFWGHDHKFTNVFIHAWEADFFSVTSHGYSYEVEIKVSRSDFLADFKKPKHQIFTGAYKKDYPGVVTYTNCPNRFFFACPEGMITTSDIPGYAGLIFISGSGSAKVIRKAPLLHDKGFLVKEMLFHKYMYENIRLREEIRDKNSLITRLKQQLENE